MPFAAALLQTIIAMGVVLVATFLSDARRWTLGTEKLRVFVSDYAPTMAIILWTGISKIGRAGHLGGDLPRVNVPRNFGTTDGPATGARERISSRDAFSRRGVVFV